MPHLTLDDRITIQEGLDKGNTIRDIAKNLNKAPSTILREIDKHKFFKGKRIPDAKPDCANKNTCGITNLCMDVRCNYQCRHCRICVNICPKYRPATCSYICKSPYVCNGCNRYNTCNFERTIYLATVAENEYQETLIGTREGLNIAADELQRIDTLISPLIKKGQSVAHIYASHGDEIGISKSTVYKYVDKRILSAQSIDMPRNVRYKVRKKTDDIKKIPNEVRIEILSHNYKRFEEYINANPDLSIVEMDTVVGCIGSKKVLLTLLFRSCNLMLAILLPNKTQEAVVSVLNWLSGELSIEVFRKLFGVILTDRGTEFLNPRAIECDENGEIKTRVYYCDPQCAWQKGALERNHELIRYVLPKGSTFDDLTQEEITLLINNINSVARDKYNGATPYKLSRILLDNKLHDVMGLKEIAPDDVLLKPTLLRNKRTTPGN